MIQLIVTVVLTMLVLSWFAHRLDDLWEAGYWYLVVAATPAMIGIAYFFSPQDERDAFIDDLKRLLWIRRR